MRLVSREYKVMLEPSGFAEPGTAVAFTRDELALAVDARDLVETRGEFGDPREREIVFLDTPGTALRRSEFILRRRFEGGKARFTLKCRSDDRYEAAGSDVRAANGFEPEIKLEEDIAPPFRCRFSHSNTVKPPRNSGLRTGDLPRTFGEASAVFPILEIVAREHRLATDEPLGIVRGVVARETVYNGVTLFFPGAGPRGQDVEATVALIVWHEGNGPTPMVAELSFRLEDPKERFTRRLAREARGAFDAMQRMNRARPKSQTKTEFVYGDHAGD